MHDSDRPDAVIGELSLYCLRVRRDKVPLPCDIEETIQGCPVGFHISVFSEVVDFVVDQREILCNKVATFILVPVAFAVLFPFLRVCGYGKQTDHADCQSSSDLQFHDSVLHKSGFGSECVVFLLLLKIIKKSRNVLECIFLL